MPEPRDFSHIIKLSGNIGVGKTLGATNGDTHVYGERENRALIVREVVLSPL